MVSSVISRLNDRRDAAADLGEDAGFTLIELMVVLLILAILLAIAIPTFLGVTGGANDRAAQSNLNTALTDRQDAGRNNSQTYSGMNATALHDQRSRASPGASVTCHHARVRSRFYVAPTVTASSWPRTRRTTTPAGTPWTTRRPWAPSNGPYVTAAERYDGQRSDERRHVLLPGEDRDQL